MTAFAIKLLFTIIFFVAPINTYSVSKKIYGLKAAIFCTCVAGVWAGLLIYAIWSN